MFEQRQTRAAEATTSWTATRIATLKTLWSVDGRSASEVGRELGVTRCAVLGKIHRLGLTGRRRSGVANPPKPLQRMPERPDKPMRTSVAGPKVMRMEPKAEASQEHPGRARDYVELGADACKWPIGDPKSADFSVCGEVRAHGPYCAHHHGVAHQSDTRQLTGSEISRLARL